MKAFRFALAALFLLMLAFSFRPSTEEPIKDEVDKNAQLFAAVFKTVNSNFVDSLDPSRLARVAIDAMMRSLDPYSVYLDEQETKDREKVWQGSLYAGIGAAVAPRDSAVMITDPYDGYGAALAGFRPGDIIHSINDTLVKNKTFEQVVGRLRGQPGTFVHVTVRRPGKGLVSAKIQRQQIFTRSILYSGMADSVTGYIKVSQFLRGSDIDFRNRVTSLKSQGAKFMILDLRDNIGGLVQEAVNCLSVFFPKGTRVCSVKGLHTGGSQDYITAIDPVDTIMPLAVLTNGVTVSSGEIFTGAIQDLDRGVVLGQRTFGKGFVQGTRFPGFGTSVYLTAARYYTPSGRCIQELDYSKKYSENKVVKYSSGLMQEFKTRKGRRVYNIGGVTPDVKTESNKMHPLLVSLSGSQFFFDFLSKESALGSVPSDPSKYIAPDDLMERFYKEVSRTDNLSQIHFGSENELEQFVKKAEQDGLTASLSRSISGIKKQMESEKLRMLKSLRPELVPILSQEMVRRYYNLSGVFGYMMKADKDILLSSRMIKNFEEYRKLLTVN